MLSVKPAGKLEKLLQTSTCFLLKAIYFLVLLNAEVNKHEILQRSELQI